MTGNDIKNNALYYRCILILAVLSGGVSAADLHVAVDGNDAWSGSLPMEE